jgi:hypothetical protein
MLQQSLSSLLHKYDNNKRGVCAAIAVPKEGVASMPDIKSIMLSTEADADCDFFAEQIILKTGFAWLDLTNDFHINIQFSEEQKPTVQNAQSTYEVALSFPNDDFATRGLQLRAYIDREFILIVKQRSGAWRVIGSLESGAVFSFNYNSGTIVKDESKFAGSFTWLVGGQTALYTRAFSALDPGLYFSIYYDLTHQSFVKISIDEAVIIDWGDGNINTYYTPTGVPQIISWLYSGPFFAIAKIYHRNLATEINVDGNGADWNFNITELHGVFPAALFLLSCKDNLITFIDISDDTDPRLKVLDARTNHLDAGATEQILSAFDDLGASNGNIQIESQAGTPALSPGAVTSKAHLVSRGWTITND